MNIRAAWDNEDNTILRYEFLKGWSWNDLYQAFEIGNSLLDSVEHRVDVIMDFTNASLFAPSGAINQAQHVANNPRHPNIGLTVVVGSSFMSGMFKMINKLAGGSTTSSKWDVTFVNTLGEAYEAIQVYTAKRDTSS